MTFDEKRAEGRLRIGLRVMYRMAYLEEAVIRKAVIQDISNSGLCLRTSTFHDKGTHIQVKIPHILEPKLGTVVWISDKEGDTYKMGVRFL